MSLLDQLRRDLNPSLNVSKDLSFTPVKSSLAALYREQMGVTHSSVCKSVAAMLNLITTAQLDYANDYHGKVEWTNSVTGAYMTLCGITKDGSKWILLFEDDKQEHAGSYEPKELDTLEVIGFLDTIERVLDISLQNIFKS